MKTYAELREIVTQNVQQTVTTFPGLGLVVIAFNLGAPVTQCAIGAEVQDLDQAIRLLRETADKLERDGKLLVHPVN